MFKLNTDEEKIKVDKRAAATPSANSAIPNINEKKVLSSLKRRRRTRLRPQHLPGKEVEEITNCRVDKGEDDDESNGDGTVPTNKGYVITAWAPSTPLKEPRMDRN